jgi:L-seryl-tRNA(Ser) seleniumtransferase
MRPDKTILAAIAATLALYRAGRAMAEIPVWRMLSTPVDALRARAEALAATLPDGSGEVVELESTVGGGSLPGQVLPSIGIALGAASGRDAADLLAELRTGEPCVVARIERELVVLDLRTVTPGDDPALAAAIARALDAASGS